MNRIGNAEAIIEFIGLLVALATFFITSRLDRKATEEQTYRDTLRATLKDFSELRRMHQSFPNNLSTLNEDDRRLAIRKYLADLERFAVVLFVSTEKG